MNNQEQKTEIEILEPLSNSVVMIYNQCLFAIEESTGHILITGNSEIEKSRLASWYSNEIQSYYYFQGDKITQDDILNISKIRNSIIFVDSINFTTPRISDIKITEQLSKPHKNKFIIISHNHPEPKVTNLFQTEITFSINKCDRKILILVKEKIENKY